MESIMGSTTEITTGIITGSTTGRANERTGSKSQLTTHAHALHVSPHLKMTCLTSP